MLHSRYFVSVVIIILSINDSFAVGPFDHSSIQVISNIRSIANMASYVTAFGNRLYNNRDVIGGTVTVTTLTYAYFNKQIDTKTCIIGGLFTCLFFNQIRLEKKQDRANRHVDQLLDNQEKIVAPLVEKVSNFSNQVSEVNKKVDLVKQDVDKFAPIINGRINSFEGEVSNIHKEITECRKNEEMRLNQVKALIKELGGMKSGIAELTNNQSKLAVAFRSYTHRNTLEELFG